MATNTRTERKLGPEELAPVVTTLRVVALMSSQVAKYTGLNIQSGSIPAWTKYKPKMTSCDIHCVRVGGNARLHDTPTLSEHTQRQIQSATEFKDHCNACATHAPVGQGAHACETNQVAQKSRHRRTADLMQQVAAHHGYGLRVDTYMDSAMSTCRNINNVSQCCTGRTQ